ncbi:hypothetical protein L1887_62070 [Cichorium endivia]|nr:hypothetical protein L1887_62070 [Cichorium endivia]
MRRSSTYGFEAEPFQQWGLGTDMMIGLGRAAGLLRAPVGISVCLEDGPDAAERRPGSGFPTGGGGQETAISRHITTYRQHRRDLGRQPDWESEDP